MFIPPNQLKDNFDPTKKSISKIQLRSSHLLIDHDLAADVFGKDQNVHVVYYPNKRMLLLAPKSDEIFKKLHKANQHMLKARNSKGDKSIALHELLIDEEIDNTDRALAYELQAGLGILNVKL